MLTRLGCKSRAWEVERMEIFFCATKNSSGAHDGTTNALIVENRRKRQVPDEDMATPRPASNCEGSSCTGHDPQEQDSSFCEA